MGGATENRVLLGPQLHSTVAASFYFAGWIGTGFNRWIDDDTLAAIDAVHARYSTPAP